MITDGFSYVAVLLFLASILVTLEKKTGWRIFNYLPAVVLVYVCSMILCSLETWDLNATKPTYNALKNSLTYAMIFTMLLRCDIRKIIRLGHKMLIGFLCGSFSIVIGFILSYAIMKPFLGPDAWMGLGALCGSWLGGAGNMIAIQSALNIGEAEMGYALIIDSVNYSIWVIILLWVIRFAPRFNRWTKADTKLLDEVSNHLEAIESATPISFQSLFLLIGSSFLVSVLGQRMGTWIYSTFSVLDSGTWTVLVITLLGLIAALSPMGRVSGSAELSNILLYLLIALLASRASLGELQDAPVWILTGFLILGIHGMIMVLLCKLFRLDLFTGAVASLSNIGGTASAPVFAGAYSGSLVPVGILMALMGYIVGTPLGLFTAKIMKLMA